MVVPINNIYFFISNNTKTDYGFIIYTKITEVTIIRAEKLLSTKSAVLDAVKHNGAILQYVPQYADDYDVVMAVVTQYEYALRNASDRLKDNKDIVLAAISQNANALDQASVRLRDDKEVVLAAVKRYGHTVRFASDRLKQDREVIFAALTQDGESLIHLSNKIRDDYELVLATVKQHGHIIRYVSERLKSDRNIVLAACSVRKHKWTIHNVYTFISPELQNDKEIIFATVSSNGKTLMNIPTEFRAKHPELDLIALKSCASAFPYVSLNLQQNYDVVLDTVSRAGRMLRYVLPEFKDDRAIVLAAVKNSGYALEYASAKLQNNKEIVMLALLCEHDMRNGSPIYYASYDMKNDYEVALNALIHNCSAWRYISVTLKNNREFLFDIAKSDAYPIHIVHRYGELQKDDDLLIEVIKSHYSRIESYKYYDEPIIELPITNIKLIHKLVNINLPDYIVFDSMYFTLRRAKCVANMNIPWSIKDEILLWLFR